MERKNKSGERRYQKAKDSTMMKKHNRRK